MAVQFVSTSIVNYFNTQTVSKLFLNSRLQYQINQLPYFDMLTLSNFVWLKSQIQTSYLKSLSKISVRQTFPLFLCLAEFSSLSIIIFMITRVLSILICQNMSKIYISFLGSIFELVGANRVHSELAVLHYSFFALATIVLVFLHPKSSSFFQIIIIFCNQFLSIHKKNLNNLSELNHYYTTNSLILCPLSNSESKTIARYGKMYLCFHPLICVSMAINVALTALMIFLVTNPKENSLCVFSSLTFYWIHSTVIILMWSSWTFCVSFNIYYIFVYYLFCAKILQIKHRKEYYSLRKLAADFHQMHRIG